MSASDPPTQSDWYMDCLRELIQDEIKATLDRKEAIENMATKSSQNPKPTRTTENHDNLEIRLRALEMTINRSRAFVTAADVDDASSSTGTQTPVTTVMSEHDVVKTPVRSISSLILRISVTRPGFNDATLMVKMYPNTPFTAVRAHLRENYSRFTNFGLMMGAQYVFDSDTPNSLGLKNYGILLYTNAPHTLDLTIAG